MHECSVFLVWNVLHHIFNAAVQNLAEHLDRMGANVFVVLEARDLAGTDMLFIDERILSHALFAHGFPQSLV